MTEVTRNPIWDDLRKPFPPEVIGHLPKGGTTLDFVGHAAVTDRLNNVLGPDNWTWEPLALDERGLPALDDKGNLWIKLAIRVGETTTVRLGYGDGSSSIKELIGDALRNAAMRFGIALDLWTKEELESTLDDPGMKNRPASRPAVATSKPAAPAPEKKADSGQIAMMLGAAKRASGLTNRTDVIDFFIDEIGMDPTEVPQFKVAEVLKSLHKGLGRAA